MTYKYATCQTITGILINVTQFTKILALETQRFKINLDVTFSWELLVSLHCGNEFTVPPLLYTVKLN